MAALQRLVNASIAALRNAASANEEQTPSPIPSNAASTNNGHESTLPTGRGGRNDGKLPTNYPRHSDDDNSGFIRNTQRHELDRPSSRFPSRGRYSETGS